MSIRIGHIIFTAMLSLSLAALSSCQSRVEPSERPEGLERRINVSFQAAAPAAVTKGAVSGDADAVTRLDLVVFRAADGILDYKGSVADAGGVDQIGGLITEGKAMHWKVLANAPAGLLDGISSEDEFNETLTLLTHTTSTTMVMHAEGTHTFTELSSSIDATLLRYGSKVSLQGISVRYLDSFGSVPSCTLETVALVNVRGQVPLTGTPDGTATGIWYNCSEIDGTLAGTALSCLVASLSTVISSSSKVDLSVDLYALPNPSTATDNAATDAEAGLPWIPRQTRVVLGLRIGGEMNWYPIDLPAMVGNKHYVVSDVVINGSGTANPDEGIAHSAIEFGISVNAWSSEGHEVGFGT